MKTATIKARAAGVALLLALVFLSACIENTDGGDEGVAVPTITVNSLLDVAAPPAGVVTLRSAMADLKPGGRIRFHRSLNGGVILLTIAGEEHSILPAETYVGMTFNGYADRDYGRSALYASRSLIIDASDLPDGIAIVWDGAVPARVLAVYGNLVLRNVTITGGHAVAEAIADPNQPYTLACGGGLAVWGAAVLSHCVLAGNRTEGDENASRDRGSFGGGIFANLVQMTDCVVSGNWAKGYGAAGGGVYSVGGADMFPVESYLRRCAISGNRTTAQHSYGGGVFSEGGGPGSNHRIVLENCTVARNLVEDNPAIPQTGGPPPPQYYYRGGGFYMSNGSVSLVSSTIAENAVIGFPAVFSGKPNMGGGGMTATIGNAHVVENMELRHSIVVGNLVNGAADDVYTGSLLHFYSQGYNQIGRLNFDQILVPIPPWQSLSRKHYPKAGDADGVTAASALDLAGVVTHPDIVSQGPDAGGQAVLYYPPGTTARDSIPRRSYEVGSTLAEYEVVDGGTDDFLALVVQRLRDDGFGPSFGSALVYDGVTWTGAARTWTTDPANAAWIKFWRDLDVEIGAGMDTVKLGDDFWGAYATGPLGDHLYIYVDRPVETFKLLDRDQLGNARPKAGAGDAGAIEAQ